MKGRYSTVILFALIAVLLHPHPGFSKRTSASKASGKRSSIASKSPKKPEKSDSEQSYVIRSGDSLYSIAKAFDTTPEALKTLNKIKRNRIKAGQTLKVPAKRSDSENESAAENQTSPASEEAPLPAGIRKQDVPDSIPTTAALPKRAQSMGRQAPKASREIHFKDYVIRRGDSLFGIAKEFDITPKELKAANKLKSNRIKVGQKLRIPVEETVVTQARNPEKPQDSRTQPIPPMAVLRQAKPEQNSDASELPIQERLVEAGFKMLGIRYRFSGTSEKTGLDCSALVKNLFSKFDIKLPRSSREQYKQGEKIDRDNLQVGDLVFFSSGGKTPTHVGVYIGNNQFLHAARKAKQVIVSDLNKLWYTTRYLGARRVMNLWWEDPEAPSDSNSKDN